MTAGGTREPLDPVRFLGNRSSGRMGVALADEALRARCRRHDAALQRAVAPGGRRGRGDADRRGSGARDAARAPLADVVLMAAAVADYRPARGGGDEAGARRRVVARARADGRTSSRAVGAARRPGQVLVGFAAETGDGLDRAREKRERKGVDLVVLNDVSRPDIGFEVGENEVALVGADGDEHLAEGREGDGRGGDPGPRRGADRIGAEWRSGLWSPIWAAACTAFACRCPGRSIT